MRNLDLSLEKMDSSFFDCEIRDVNDILSLVSNVMIHKYWTTYYGLSLDSANLDSQYELLISKKIETLKKRRYTSVSQSIKLEDKIVGICRDLVLMSVYLCLKHNIVARPLVGFATYLDDDKFIDHWIFEVYLENEGRWIYVDPQLDSIQSKLLNIDFDASDIPKEKFIQAHEAWINVRSNESDPIRYGIKEWWGYDYLIINLILEVNVIFNCSLYPWSQFNNLSYDRFSENDYNVFDEIAKLIEKKDYVQLEIIARKHNLIAPENYDDIKSLF